MLGTLPPEERDAATGAGFDYAAHLRRYLRTQVAEPTRGFLAWQRTFDAMAEATLADGKRFVATDTSLLSDRDLMRHIDAAIEREGQYYRELWIPWWIFARDMAGVLGGMIEAWYDGDNEFALVDLMSGVPKRTVTMVENRRLWQLSERIRGSRTLRTAFEAGDGARFLAALPDLGDEGREYLADYQEFLREYGHRGHADRDTYFLRRCEDPEIDYRAINAMLGIEEPVDPLVKEHEINTRREAVVDDVVARIRRRPFGGLRAEAFTFVHDYVLKFLMSRDNERTLADMTTLAIKRGCQEISRRLIERGLLEEQDAYHYLAKHELYALLEGPTGDLALVKAKIAARRVNFHRYLERTANLPTYIHRNKGVDLDVAAIGAQDRVLRGSGTSRGSVTGTARVVHSLDAIGRVRNGEILICHATDPGWTPVFLVISGLVLETGGVLAHGSCLSREYGLPCVQVAGATGLIPDGATITLNGDTGTVVIESVPESGTESESGTEPDTGPDGPHPVETASALVAG
jgi:pyruvate,water dikinase